MNNPPSLILSSGNIVNVGFHLYRSHLKKYFQLSLIAHLWLLIPIYGWAKFLAISAQISRLAFSELLGQPESFNFVRSHVNRRMWQLLIADILVKIITFFVVILLVALLFLSAILLAVGIALFLAALGLNPNTTLSRDIGFWVGVVIALLIYIIVPIAYLWIYSRLFIAELPLAVESNINAWGTIKRNWELTKKSVKHVLGVVLSAFLTCFPILIIVYFIVSLLLGIMLRFLPLSYEYYNLASALLLIFISILNGLITMPFWQAIKAVFYYDVQSRREGLGLRISDRNNLDRN